MKTLIFGGSSLLGKYLIKTKSDYITELHSTWHSNPIDGFQCDITQKSQVAHIIDRVKPNLIINCAAIGSVDYVDNHYQECFNVNVAGLENIIYSAPDSQIVHISSNAVYEGDKPPYNEQSPQMPVNLYGKLKLKAEQSLMIHPDWLVIRPFLLYGWPTQRGRQNWVTTIIDRLGKGEKIALVNDTYWMPTYAYDCAKAIWILAGDGYKESYNIASPDVVTLYEFGLKIAKVWGLDQELISPVLSDKFNYLSPRPKDTRYDLVKLKENYKELRGLEEGLQAMKNEL